MTFGIALSYKENREKSKSEINRLTVLFYLFQMKHTIEAETELFSLKKHLQKYNSFLHPIFFSTILEIFYGFSLGVATFAVLPSAIELVGIFPAAFGIFLGISVVMLLRKFALILCGFILLIYHFSPMPFRHYYLNGLFLGGLAGIVFAIQTSHLSLTSKENISFKNSGIWYLLGLIMGILLK